MAGFTDKIRSMFGPKKPKKRTISAPMQQGAPHAHSSNPAGDSSISRQPQVQQKEESGMYQIMNDPEEAARNNDPEKEQTRDTVDELSSMVGYMNTGGPARSIRPLSTVPEHSSSPYFQKTFDGLGAQVTKLPSSQASSSRTYTALAPMDNTEYDATSTRSEHAMSDDTATSTLHGDSEEPIGQWRCCKCKRGQDLHLNNQGQHLVSTLNCVCPHRSCEVED
jgi:hypothetical protein